MNNEEKYSPYSTITVLKKTKERLNDLRIEINQKYSNTFDSQKFFPNTTFFAGLASFLEKEDVKKQFVHHLKGGNNIG